MRDWKVLAARVISAAVCLIGGGMLQIAFWKTPDVTYAAALIRHPYLWIIYFLVALLAGEHSLRLMKRKK